MSDLLVKIEEILRRDPIRMYSKEEILNLLAPIKNAREIEALLVELEVESSLRERGSRIYCTCQGGRVYYKWNKT
jgi:hypothetical protein